MRKTPNRIVQFLAIPIDNPELLKAQGAAFSRLVPLLYVMLLTNGWMLAATYFGKAPNWLTIYAAAAMTLLSVIRLLMWWRVKKMIGTAEHVARELRRTNIMMMFNGIVMPGWALMLIPYGGIVEQFHVAFFLTLSMIGSMFCTLHLRSAAIFAAIFIGSAVIFSFISAGGEAIFLRMGVNVFLVTAVLLAIVLIQNRDFSRMVNAQTEARRKDEAQTRLLHMIDDMPVAVITVEPKTPIINYANETSKGLIRRIEHLLPVRADDLVGTSIDVFHRNPQYQRRILGDPKNLPHNARIKLGSEVLDLKISAVMADDGSYIGPMLTLALVTKEVEAENRIRQLAHYDTLTGLPNRVTFREELAKGLATPGNRVGVLYIDLDGFKLVNDTRGHPVGDALLGQVASRLRTACDGPAMTVGRLGGDEFAVLVPHNNAASATALANKIIEALSAPYDLDYDKSIQLGASVGIALAPDHGERADALLARADLALYAAKAAGKGQAHIFSPAMETRVQERVRLEEKLRTALETKDGLFVFYQPIINVETGEVAAREALG